MVDTAQHSDSPQWEDLLPGPGRPALYTPIPRTSVSRIRADDQVILADGHNLTGPCWTWSRHASDERRSVSALIEGFRP